DLLHGDRGDALDQNADRQRIHSGAGDDFLQGNQGDDILWGDLSDNTLCGVLGAHVFAIATASGTTHITDLAIGPNRIDLSEAQIVFLFAFIAAQLRPSVVTTLRTQQLSDTQTGIRVLVGTPFQAVRVVPLVNGNVIRYPYDAVGNLVHLHLNPTMQYEYDGANRLVKATDAMNRALA